MAAKKTKQPFGAKTQFVLSLPRELPAKDVVAKGKQQGLTLSEAHVYKIRSTAKGKPAGKSAAAKAPRGKPSASSAGSAGAAPASSSKRDFVLSFGAETTPAEILRHAKQAGVSLSKAYVYTIRSSAGGSAGRGRKPAAAASAGRPRAAGGSSSLESQFIDAAIDMGLARANAVLESLRSRLKQGF